MVVIRSGNDTVIMILPYTIDLYFKIYASLKGKKNYTDIHVYTLSFFISLYFYEIQHFKGYTNDISVQQTHTTSIPLNNFLLTDLFFEGI